MEFESDDEDKMVEIFRIRLRDFSTKIMRKTRKMVHHGCLRREKYCLNTQNMSSGQLSIEKASYKFSPGISANIPYFLSMMES